MSLIWELELSVCNNEVSAYQSDHYTEVQLCTFSLNSSLTVSCCFGLSLS